MVTLLKQVKNDHYKCCFLRLFMSKRPITVERLGFSGWLVSHDKWLQRPQVPVDLGQKQDEQDDVVNFAWPPRDTAGRQRTIGRRSSIISLTFGPCRTPGPESPCPIHLDQRSDVQTR